ncbi:hypothetical protein [Planctomycetes bacterium TBK1r]|uniref:Rhomboid family protein n=1 Tax=Stieleria magnilauensis TaxID=2527963 RepID=A0ABX5XUT2_9BACT|nr:hypothetical protein TBK1r_47150 [Planctomycetes bacterium TBK1r]
MNLPKKIPFTLLMLSLLVVAGIYGQTHIGLLDADVRDDVGFSTRLLFSGHLHRIFTSLFFTAGGWRFYSSLLMFAVGVGWVEYSRGTKQTAASFFAIHVLTVLLLSLFVTWPLTAIETRHGLTMFDARDVGPSAGYYGCLGFALAGLKRKPRNVIVAMIFIVLIGRLTWSSIHLPEDGRMLLADLAHLIAFPLGLSAEMYSRVFLSRDDLTD